MKEGIKAGLTPPPYPRLQRSEAAVLSRAAEIPYRLLRNLEIAQTGPEGIMKTVREELGGQMYYLPENRLTHSPEQGATVAIASNNSIKTQELHTILETTAGGGFTVIRVPEAEELHTENVFLDAESKAHDAANKIETSQADERRQVRLRPYVTMATDQLNAVPTYTEDPETGVRSLTFQRKGKPTTANPENALESIKETFRQMDQMAYGLNWTSVPYLIELATVIHNPKNPDNDAFSIQKSVVFLNKDILHQIAYSRFDEYVERANRILGGLGKPGDNGVTSNRDVTGIAAGVEIQALQEMGAVEFVTGTPTEVSSQGFPDQREDAREHAYRLALGRADKKLITDYFTSDAN